jgi:hypothetical protein
MNNKRCSMKDKPSAQKKTKKNSPIRRTASADMAESEHQTLGFACCKPWRSFFQAGA